MESLAMEVFSLGRGLGASRGLVGSSRLNFSDPNHGASSCSDRYKSVCRQTQTGHDAGILGFYTLAGMGGTDRRRRLT